MGIHSRGANRMEQRQPLGGSPVSCRRFTTEKRRARTCSHSLKRPSRMVLRSAPPRGNARLRRLKRILNLGPEAIPMIICHYGHRLPDNYDLGLIKALTEERGPIWDTRPELYFKAFLLRESGRFGAIANNFSSLYLWRQDDAFRDWLVSGGYRIVTDLFGRAEIETRFALDARR